MPLRILPPDPNQGPRKIASASMPLDLFHAVKSAAAAANHTVSSYLCALAEAQLRPERRK